MGISAPSILDAGPEEGSLQAANVLPLSVIDDPRLEQARLWRLKAEELRTVADQTRNPLTRDSLPRTAECYDQLAHQCEDQAAGAAKKSEPIC
jgi:hypothetical protein